MKSLTASSFKGLLFALSTFLITGTVIWPQPSHAAVWVCTTYRTTVIVDGVAHHDTVQDCQFHGGYGGGGPGSNDYGGGGGVATGNPGDASQPTVSNNDQEIKCGQMAGNPIVYATGNKVEFEQDFVTRGEMGLHLSRTYNHYWQGTGIFGGHWLTNFDYSLVRTGSSPEIWLQKPDGRRVKFVRVGSTQRFNEDRAEPIAYIEYNASSATYTHRSEEGTVEQYNVFGYVTRIDNKFGVGWTFNYLSNRLQSVVHTSGRQVTFTWVNGQLVTVTDPDGKPVHYTYALNALGTGRHRLATVTYSGSPATTVQYHYEDARFKGALTGKSFNGVRYSTFAYNPEGRATLSEHAGGVERYTFQYVLDQAPPVTPPPQPPPPGGSCDPLTRICTVPLGGRTAIAPGKGVAAATGAAGRIKRVIQTNPLGKTTTYEYAEGRLTGVIGQASAHCPAATKVLLYDVNGNLEATEDFAGNLTNYVFNNRGQLITLREGVGTPSERVTTRTWDPITNLPVKVTINGYQETIYAYGPDLRLSAITTKNLTANGVPNQTRTTTYTYNKHANGMVASIAVDGPLAGVGDVRTTRYNDKGDLLSEENALAHKITYSTHDGLSRPGKSVGINGDITENTYDARGRVTRQRRNAGAAADTEYRYNEFGALRMLMHPDGHRQNFEYDAAQRLTHVSEALPQGEYGVRSLQYNNASLVTVETSTVSAYPHGSRIKGVIDGVVGGPANGYSVVGWACSTHMDQSIQVHMYLGGPAGSGTIVGGFAANLGSEAAVANACEAQGAAYRFNIALSQAVLTQHAGKKIYIHGISPAGSGNNTIAGSGTVAVPGGAQPPSPPPPLPPICPPPLRCEIQGRPTDRFATALTSPALPMARTVYTDYDELGRVRARRGSNGQDINATYSYDANSNLTQVLDGAGNATDYIFDALGRMSALIDGEEGVTTFGYDAGNNLIRVVDARGNITTYKFDGFGQLWSQSSPDTGTTTFTYNAAGQRTALSRNDGSVLTYQYNDTLGRPTSILAPGQARDFIYDGCANGKGMLCAINFRDPSAVLSHSAFYYFKDGSIEARHDIGSGANDITRYRYDGMGRTTRITYPSGVHADYAYFRGKVSSLTAVLPSGSSHNIANDLEYTPWGDLESWTFGNGIARKKAFDEDGRLIGLSSRYGSTMHQSLTLAYSADGLIRAITDGVDPSRSHKYKYDGVGRLTEDLIGSSDKSVYGFDALGNRTSLNRYQNSHLPSTLTYPMDSESNRMLAMNGAVNKNLSYNSRGHLQSSSGWQDQRSYTYDGFDRLSSTSVNGSTTSYLVNALDQRVKKTGPLGTFRYVYTGQNSLLGEHTGAGATGWRSFFYLAGQPVAIVSENNLRYFLHSDHLGRPELMTDSSRASVWKAFNGSYSRGVTLGDPTAVILGFPGQLWDAETDTWYNGFRDYDQYTGRYLQSDPVGLAGGLNTYAYVGGNPVNYVDPTGLGPVAFGVCTVANIAHQAYSYHQALKVDGMDDLQAKLKAVNKKIGECPLDDDSQYMSLVAEREEIGLQILGATKAHAQSNAGYTLSNIGTGLLWEAACGALLFAPIP